MIQVKNIKVGGLETNCYLAGEGNDYVLIDPGDEAQKIVKSLKVESSKVKAIICTHGHYDHIGAIADLQKKYDFPVWMHEDEKQVLVRMFEGFNVEKFKVDRWLKDGEVLEIGPWSLKVIHTPGHTPGGICLYDNDNIFTGDTLFADGYLGRTDMSGGSQEKIMASLAKLMQLPETLKVYPGHEGSSTIAAEKKLHHRVGTRS